MKIQRASFLIKHIFQLIFIIGLLNPVFCFGQNIEISGIVTNLNNQPIEGVSVVISSVNKGTSTNKLGKFNLSIPLKEKVTIIFSHVKYKKILRSYKIDAEKKSLSVNVILETDIKQLNQIEVKDETESQIIREKISVTKLDPRSAQVLPSPFGDFNKVLATLPGVVSNNELSSTYSVRGGNFDENLVYVNGMKIYRPFLIRSGQQEGLSFINPDLVKSIEFSAGGWQAKYGDKLSSSLNIEYKTPTEFSGSTTLGLLGGTAHLEGTNKKKSITYLLGARHKNSQYLLSTQETKGGYRPKFTDIQSYLDFDLSKEKDNSTSLGILFSFARNRYLVTPETRETNFGTLSTPLRLLVAFDGREVLNYDIIQGGISLKHKFSKNFKSTLTVSGMQSIERENFDIEGGYRLCDVDKNPNSVGFNNCLTTLGVGTDFDHGRNKLKAQILDIVNSNAVVLNDKNKFEFGLGYSLQKIDDTIDEFSFEDSLDFVTITDVLKTDLSLQTNIFTGFLQHTYFINDRQSVTYGIRLNYRDLNNQLLISPRAQYSIRPNWVRDVVIKAAIGVYQQPPFYRELRDFDGVLHKDLKAQRSLHFITGLDYNFKWWSRDFKLVSEIYYKKLNNVITYDVDNVRVRYYASNRAKAYAAGIDFRVSGEFIKGTESWFSLSLLNTKEDLEDDNKGYVRRPTDQHINLGIFFQDHLPNDPTVKVNLNFLFGSGLPFGSPNNINHRNSLRGRAYRRVDIGFLKYFEMKNNKYIKSISIGLDVLNLFGVDNTISYTWIKDVNNDSWGVPNNLSQRFFNLKARVLF